MIGQSGAVIVGLEGLELRQAGLVVEVQLKAHGLGGVDGVPQGLVERIDIVPVQVDGAQQIEGVLPVGGLPQQALGAGVVGVVYCQDQPVGHDHGLLIGAGALQRQISRLISLDHTQAGEEGRGPFFHTGQLIGRRLLVQGVHHAASGAVHHQARGVRRPLGQFQQSQFVGHDLAHVLHLLRGHRALDVSCIGIVHQPQGIAVGHGVHRPFIGHLRL